MYVLLIDTEDDYELPDVYGPFDTIELGQAYAQAWRERQGLPGPATPANNDQWTQQGWVFAILGLGYESDLVKEGP